MKLAIPIICLAFFICLSRLVRAETVQVDTLTYDYGGLNGFYSIGYHISMGLVPKLSEELLGKIADLITDNGGNVNDVANDILKAYAGPIVFMVFGGILALVAAISCIVVCCGRCFCKCCRATNQPAHESQTSLYIASFFLFASFAFVLTGAVIYGKAVDDTYDTLREDAFKDIVKIISDLETLVANTTAEITDSVSKNVNTTFQETINEIDGFSVELVNQFETQTGLLIFTKGKENRTAATDAVDGLLTKSNKSLQKIEGKSEKDEVKTLEKNVNEIQIALKALTDAMTKIDSDMGDVNKAVGNFQTEINKALADSQNELTQANKDITQTTNDITKAINDIHESLQKVENTIQDWIDDVKDWSGLKAFRSGMQAAGLLPLSVALLLLIIGLVAGIVRITRPQKKPHERSTLSHVSGGCSVAGIYVGFMVSAFIMVMAVIFFFGGFVVSSVCKPVFRDDAYALYRASNDFEIEVDPYGEKNAPIETNIGEIFQECNSKTMFSLIGGEQIINTNDVMSTINFTSLETNALNAIPNPFWNFNPKPDISNSVTVAINAWNKAADPIQNANDFLTETRKAYPNDLDVINARSDLKNLQSSLNDLSIILEQYRNGANTFQTYLQDDPKTRAMLTDEVKQTFSNVEQTTRNGIDDFINGLMDDVAPCSPFLTLYDNVGVLVCDHIGRPVHGMWAALGLAALALIPAAYSLLLLVRWLLKMDQHYYQGEMEDASAMAWSGPASPSKVTTTAPTTSNMYSYPRDPSMDELDLRSGPIVDPYPIGGEDYPSDYSEHRPNSVYPEIGLPRANRGFEEYSSNDRRTENWDIPLPDHSPPSTTQRLRRF